MKIISRYVLREHLGPLTFALTALTSLLLLNFISRQLGELVGKGLPWSVIGEFLLLSIPFTIALTVPMSVLVSVLYAFSRLAAENEVTALKANGVSPLRLVSPAIGLGLVFSLGLLAFNDQVLPRANHHLKTLQEDISQTRPTLALNEQVINPIAEGKFYLKAGRIEQGSGKMWDIVIYNLADPMRRRTIYAQRGRITWRTNMKDIDMELFEGQILEVATDKPSQLDRLFFKHDRIRVADVGRGFSKSATDSLSKGDREMGICEMQDRLWQADALYRSARTEYEVAKTAPANAARTMPEMLRTRTPEPRGIGWAYCRMLRAVGAVTTVRQVQAAEPGPPAAPRATDVAMTQDTTPKRVDSVAAKRTADSVAAKRTADSVAAVARAADTLVRTVPGQIAVPVPVVPDPNAAAMAAAQAQIAAQAAAELFRSQNTVVPVPVVTTVPGPGLFAARAAEAKMRLDQVSRSRDRYDIEIHKKFSLAAACLIFVIVAAPIAVRFPRGGVGLVIGVSLVVFALYYVGLIGGESLANNGYLRPFWAMWGTNVIMTVVGTILMLRMGYDTGSGRGGGISEMLDNWRARRADRRARRTA